MSGFLQHFLHLPRPRLGNVLILFGVAITLILISFLREVDLTDECYLYYEAQAAWNAGPQHGGSNPVHKQFGLILGLPFALKADANFLHLRLWSGLLWFLAFASLAANLPRSRQDTLWALPLPLLLYTWHMPMLTYQSLPAVFIALSLATWFRSRCTCPIRSTIWAVVCGQLLGFAPLTHPPLWPLFVCLALPAIVFHPRRFALALGYLLSSASYFLYRTVQRDLLLDRWKQYVPQSTGDLSLVTPGYWQTVQHVIEHRLPGIVCMAAMFAGCLLLGFLLRHRLQLLARETGKPFAVTRIVLLLAGLITFTLAWEFGHWKNRTLNGLLLLPLLVALPILLSGKHRSTLCLCSLLVIVFGVAHGQAGDHRTLTYYPMFYAPLLWVPAVIAAAERFPSATMRPIYLALLALNLFIGLQHGHRAAGVLHVPPTRAIDSCFGGLPMRQERIGAIQRLQETIPEDANVLGIHQQVFPYLVLDRAAPFGNAFTHHVTDGLIEQAGLKFEGDFFVVGDRALGGSDVPAAFDRLYREREYQLEELGAGLLLAVPQSSKAGHYPLGTHREQ